MRRMNPMRKTPKTKQTSLEILATAIQQDFSAIRDEMNAGFHDVRKEMAGGFIDVRKEVGKIREDMATREDLAAVGDRISIAKEDIQEQIAGLRYAKEIDALAERLKFVEQKLGIKHARRAA
jgi:hypothetical protein